MPRLESPDDLSLVDDDVPHDGPPMFRREATLQQAREVGRSSSVEIAGRVVSM